MELTLPLDKITTLEKMRALEEIWDDLSREPEEVPFPSWHADVLDAREKRISEGKSKFVDWDEAKRAIRNEVQ